MDVHLAPVVQAGPFQIAVVSGETEFADEMESCAGCAAETGDVAGVWGDLRFDQDNMEWYVYRHETP
jgi:hypothetical protein